jgi:short-subunit dehydrogenase
MKCALITGASSGIGEALARQLASKGYALIVTGRNRERLEAIAQEVKAKKSIVADLKEPDHRQQLVAIIRKELPDLVVNNAGFGIYGDAFTISIKDQLSMVDVNAAVPLEFTLEAVRAWSAAGKRGIVMNVSSTAGDYPCPGMSVYGASKSFLTQVSRALNTEVNPQGIYVLASCPGMTNTNFASHAAGKHIRIHERAVMTAAFAAEQIWRQIEKRQEKHIFNWQYRLASFFAYHFIPCSWVKKIIWNQIKNRL